MGKLRFRKKMHEDEGGAQEKLPLYLILLVVIMGIAIFALVSWLNYIRPPQLTEIKVYIDGVLSDPPNTTVGTHDIYIIAWDDDDKPLKDVTIEIKGAGFNRKSKTDDNGRANFRHLTFVIEGEFNATMVSIDAYHEQSYPIKEDMLVFK